MEDRKPRKSNNPKKRRQEVIDEHDARMNREYQRQEVVRAAVNAADQVILDGSDGTSEMTDRLTEKVAISFLEVLHLGHFDARKRLFLSFGKDNGIVLKAVNTALKIIEEFSETDLVVTRWLYYELAKAFVEKVGNAISSELTRYDMENPASRED